MTLAAKQICEKMETLEDIVVINNTGVAADKHSHSIDPLIPLTVVYAFIFVAGILGNTSTCLVIARNRSMHTATNFYLFSLAISDLILLMCGLPIELYKLWSPYRYPLSEPLCITLGLASETSANATVLTITAFTVERYIAICRPFMSHTMSKLSRAVRFIIAIWIIALCLAAPQAMQFGIETVEQNGQNITSCTVIHGVHEVFVTSSFVFFVVPMSVISVLYALIGIKLRTSRVLYPPKKLSVESHDRSNGGMPPRNGKSQQRVIRMLVAVAVSFFICWAPFHLQRLLAIYGKSLEHPSPKFYSIYVVLTYISGILYFLSTAINPVLYNIMSNKFRNAFKVTLAAWCGRRRRSGARLDRTYSAMLASRRQRAAEVAAGRSRTARRLHRFTTATTLYDAPPRAQCCQERHVSIVSENPSSSGEWGRRPWRLRYEEPSDSYVSPQSISNSSLREVDDGISGAELATYMRQVNCEIGGLT